MEDWKQLEKEDEPNYPNIKDYNQSDNYRKFIFDGLKGGTEFLYQRTEIDGDRVEKLKITDDLTLNFREFHDLKRKYPDNLPKTVLYIELTMILGKDQIKIIYFKNTIMLNVNGINLSSIKTKGNTITFSIDPKDSKILKKSPLFKHSKKLLETRYKIELDDLDFLYIDFDNFLSHDLHNYYINPWTTWSYFFSNSYIEGYFTDPYKEMKI